VVVQIAHLHQQRTVSRARLYHLHFMVVHQHIIVVQILRAVQVLPLTGKGVATLQCSDVLDKYSLTSITHFHPSPHPGKPQLLHCHPPLLTISILYPLLGCTTQ
jgi:hypothetical protein